MQIRDIIKLLEAADAQNGDKIGRWAFIYLEAKGDKDKFAQCSTCRHFLPGKERCGIFDKDHKVVADASCGLYVLGTPTDDQELTASVTPEEAGYVVKQVRCENCSWYVDGECDLYKQLNAAMPDTFELGTDVDAKACCNAWSA